ncbi:MAG: 6-phosphogluconolactonase [Synechococcus sp. SB0673_bin_10]|nr:6-phosphogluconolactonase [Cyanobacteria bacterium MAG IRC1_bin_28]MXX08687.1 6-phosphogluconolactonase [Synechococcus sp. SB0667_bin_8]MYF37139.1 6-phosphogluconolactonase [Synechococcus sp. SB0678_bin_12]MYI71096.1 6-phosphogluconolactonase [Synechococcus sp. SB0673_bin_10]MYI88632.1 6-phosphogluconolactonase [Synechococcus sp. SB0672_bin_10]
MTRYRLQSSPDKAALAQAAAAAMTAVIRAATTRQPRCCVVALAGGSTPEAAYGHLGQEDLPWERVNLVLGDERWVDAQDPASNARMVRRCLLSGSRAHRARLHPVPTHLPSPEAAAQAYGDLLRTLCPGQPPQLDLVLLGLGDDGHTASLFPGTAAVDVKDRWVTVGWGKDLPRVSMTAPLLSAAQQVIILVAGAAKRQALQRLLDPDENPARTPAKLVAPKGEVLVLCDEAALPED